MEMLRLSLRLTVSPTMNTAGGSDQQDIKTSMETKTTTVRSIEETKEYKQVKLKKIISTIQTSYSITKKI